MLDISRRRFLQLSAVSWAGYRTVEIAHGLARDFLPKSPNRYVEENIENLPPLLDFSEGIKPFVREVIYKQKIVEKTYSKALGRIAENNGEKVMLGDMFLAALKDAYQLLPDTPSKTDDAVHAASIALAGIGPYILPFEFPNFGYSQNIVDFKIKQAGFWAYTHKKGIPTVFPGEESICFSKFDSSLRCEGRDRFVHFSSFLALANTYLYANFNKAPDMAKLPLVLRLSIYTSPTIATEANVLTFLVGWGLESKQTIDELKRKGEYGYTNKEHTPSGLTDYPLFLYDIKANNLGAKIANILAPPTTFDSIEKAVEIMNSPKVNTL